MKKIYLYLPLFFTLAACGEENANPPKTFFSSFFTPSEQDVVNKHGKITNLTHFEEFFENVQYSRKDAVRIVAYTIEGDAIITELQFDGSTIEYILDTTRDAYGQQEVITTNCTSIEKLETEETIEYQIAGCENETDGTLLIVDQ